MPNRVQRKRIKSWRKPPGGIIVDRIMPCHIDVLLRVVNE